uniref:Uncharacterized protein n=1 Tax=viral metagenome TaxID=1070528 RepID=A0A6M3X4I1_9ZZZZ
MLKNELDVLVITHNTCIAFEYLTPKKQEYFVRQLRMIEREICAAAQSAKQKTEREGE